MANVFDRGVTVQRYVLVPPLVSDKMKSSIVDILRSFFLKIQFIYIGKTRCGTDGDYVGGFMTDGLRLMVHSRIRRAFQMESKIVVCY